MTQDTKPSIAETEAQMKGLEQTVSAMITLLGKETEAVKAIDVSTFIALQDEKSVVLDDYQSRLRTLLTHKENIKTLPDSMKQRMRDLEHSLSIARVENMARLERAGKSFERLRDRIVHIARETAIRTGASYGPTGLMRTSARKTISTGVHDQA